MDIETPAGWRKGQTIFNFLEWLRTEKDIHSANTAYRMVDPFHIPDEKLDQLYAEFLKENSNTISF